jgi:hypothetical protein
LNVRLAAAPIRLAHEAEIQIALNLNTTKGR